MGMVIVKIGHLEILLPNDQGVATIIKTLSKGVLCSDYLFAGEVRIDTERALEIGMKSVPRTAKLVDPNRKLTPEEQGYVRIKPKRLGQGLLLLEGGTHVQ